MAAVASLGCANETRAAPGSFSKCIWNFEKVMVYVNNELELEDCSGIKRSLLKKIGMSDLSRKNKVWLVLKIILKERSTEKSYYSLPSINLQGKYFEQFMKLPVKMENYSTRKLGKLTWTLTRVPKRVKWLLIWAIVLRPEGIFLTRSLEAPPCRPPCAPPRPRPRPPRRL